VDHSRRGISIADSYRVDSPLAVTRCTQIVDHAGDEVRPRFECKSGNNERWWARHSGATWRLRASLRTLRFTSRDLNLLAIIPRFGYTYLQAPDPGPSDRLSSVGSIPPNLPGRKFTQVLLASLDLSCQKRSSASASRRQH
jgi:hypothetical protein